MQIYFTSDTHFSHYSMVVRRGFGSIQEHDEFLIQKWNSVVSPKDHIYHLGDVAFLSYEKTNRLLERLNGVKHLIYGNHDDRLMGNPTPQFKWKQHGAFVRWMRQKIYLHHYACRVWRCSHYGAWHLYGHSHGSLYDSGETKSLDVGVDCWDYAPVSFDQLKEIMDKREILVVDHHGVD